MKRFARNGLLISSVFLTAYSLPAKEFLDIGKIIEQAASATPENYPDSNSVLLDDFIQVEYQVDGSFESWNDTAIKILTEKGKRENRILALHFNLAYGTSYFSRVQIIRPNGEINEINIEANSRIMVDPGQMNANIYNPNLKVLNLSVPDLKMGDTLRYLIHRIRHKAVVPGTFSDYQVFEHTIPYERSTYQVIAPRERPLIKIALKDEIPGTVQFNKTITEQGRKVVYTWKIKNVPRMFDEPNMPTRHTVVQRLLISTMEKWEYLSRWYWKLCLPRLQAVTPEMEKKAKELTAGMEGTMEKINAVFNFVSQDIRYMGITTEDEAPGYEPHDVSITFSNRYGVCRDKAALLAAMLRMAGVEAFPVIIMAGPKKDEEVPQPFFNHAITAALDEDGNYVLMDSTDENTKDIFPAYLQNMSYIVARPEGETLLTSPVIPVKNNLLLIHSTGSLDNTGNLAAKSTLTFEGINDTVYRGYLSRIKPEERRRFFEGHIKRSMPTAQLHSLKILPQELRDTAQPLKVSFSYSAKNLLIEGQWNKMLALPRLSSSLGYANFLIRQTGLEKREYPLYTRMTAGIREILKLNIPPDIGTFNLPDYQPIHSDELTWNAQTSLNRKTLSTTNTFLLNAVEFTPKRYLLLKEQLKDIEYNLRKKLILDLPITHNIVEPDIRLLEHNVHIVLKDTGSWTEISRRKLEILTYSGKKNYAEIKLPYNPAWQHIELTKATVTLPDGTVKKINEEEINLMDARWTASAPRYPAEKILVASLPGVAVGSVVEYEFVSTVNSKPFFSAIHTFNDHEPVENKTLSLTAPESLPLKIRNTGIAETHTGSESTTSFIWQAENLPAVKKEEALPPWYAFNPAVFISTGDWKSYGELVLTHLTEAAKNQPITEQLAKELITTLRDETAKVVLLRNWTAENIRPAGPDMTALPLSSITAADRTLKDRYGNNPDRMVLLYTLLKAAGFKPEFILSGRLSLIPEVAEPKLAIPERMAFGVVLVKANVSGETVYFEGASQYAEPGTSKYDRCAMLNLQTGEIGAINVVPKKADRSHTVHEIGIATNGQTILAQSTQIQGTAYESFHQHYAEITPEERRRHYLEMTAKVSQSAKASSELITDYTAYPGKLQYSVVAEHYAVMDGDYLYFTVPGGLGGLLKYHSDTRSLPLVWNRYVDTANEYNIQLPEGYEPVIMPFAFSWKAPEGAGIVEVTVKYSPQANVIRMSQRATLKPALIQAENFPSIVQAFRKLAHPGMHTILLKKKAD